MAENNASRQPPRHDRLRFDPEILMCPRSSRVAEMVGTGVLEEIAQAPFES